MISDRQKDGLAVLLCVAGLAVLGSIWSRSHPTQERPRLDQAVRQHFDTRALLSSQGFTFEGRSPALPSHGLLALFVLHGRVCSPCLNEAAEYAELLEEVRGVEVRALALVVHEDPLQALRFIKVSGLPMPAGFGKPAVLARLLGEAGRREEWMSIPQLVFVQRPEDLLFYQVPLLNTTTDVEDKREVLERMLSAAGAQARPALHHNRRAREGGRMRNRSNLRLAVALLFFLLTLVASALVVDRAQAQTNCFRCGVCNEKPLGEPSDPFACCKPKLPGYEGRTECQDGDAEFGFCELAGNPC